MTVQALDKSLCKTIASLFKEAFSDGWTENMLASAFDTQRFYALGTYDGDKLVGVITFSYSVDTADIEDVAVDSNYRRSGIASSLIKAAVDKITKDGKVKIFLEVRAGNIPAINLYLKAGFSRISVRKKYYGDGEDAVVMIKE